MDSPLRRKAVAAGAAAALLLAGCSTATAADSGDAATSAASSATGGNSGATTSTGTGLFDSSTVHSLSISYDQAAYEAMIATFQSSGEKEWITATVTIDGTTFSDVGIKLKGNSTLQSLRGEGAGRGTGGTLSADQPEGLPWRIRLDKNVDGQNYQGATDIVVRGGSTETSLNEAVALQLIGDAGLATQEATPSSFSVNGGAAQLRLVIENPDEAWDEANFGDDGILYKAEASGDYSYRGDDPSAYTDVFEIEAAGDANEDNYAPLIAFLKWLNESDDATFAAELGNYVDIDSFATYLAIQDLVANSDDIDGPGNNSYLRYDVTTKKFTVVSWDQNLSFGGMGGQGGAGPGGAGGMGQRPQGAGQAPGGQAGGGMGGGRGGNVLTEKFTANTDFAALVAAAKTELTADLYTSGRAQQVLDSWTSVLLAQATGLVSADTINSESAAVAKYFTSS